MLEESANSVLPLSVGMYFENPSYPTIFDQSEGGGREQDDG